MSTSQLYKLVAQKVPRQLSQKRLRVHFLEDFFIWSAMFIGYHHCHWILWPAFSGLFAAFSFRSFGMMHEAVHGSTSYNRISNEYVGLFYGVFCFLPFDSWRRVHLEHHFWTGNVERDPSASLLAKFKKRGYTNARYIQWGWKYWIPILAFMQHVVFWKAIKSKREFAFAMLSIAYLLIANLVIGPAILIIGLGIYLYMVEIINFPHHLGLKQFNGTSRFSNAQQAQFTRSCLYPRWLAHYVLLNFNLHTEHHLFPSHPWYALDEIHSEIREHKMLLNTCVGNDWILQNRSRNIDVVMMDSFEDESQKIAS